MASSTPMIVSADDHVVEPPSIWVDRLPAKYRGIGPHFERDRVRAEADGISHKLVSDPSGEWADVWCYEDNREPLG